MLFHTGSIMGFQAYFAVHLQQGLGIVILGNGPADRKLRERIITRLFQTARSPLPDLQWRGTEGFAGRFVGRRSEEHTSELQSLMRISYAVFCLKKKKHKSNRTIVRELIDTIKPST